MKGLGKDYKVTFKVKTVKDRSVTADLMARIVQDYMKKYGEVTNQILLLKEKTLLLYGISLPGDYFDGLIESIVDLCMATEDGIDNHH